MARIALDAMGGDNAPTETVAGAVEAAERGVEVVLVGNHSVLEAELAKHHVRLPIVEAPEVIAMGDDPARALREKPGASPGTTIMEMPPAPLPAPGRPKARRPR